jgi:non-canonical (house-cleaning) NTP pyrophosphatase
MAHQLSDFLGGYQRGIEVAVAGSVPEELLGVREAFRRFFHDGLGRPAPVAVVPQEVDRRLRGIAESDLDAIAGASAAARGLADRLGDSYQFFVGTEVCVQQLEGGGPDRFFLRSWTAVIGPPGEATGASGSLGMPQRLVQGLSVGELGVALPGTRRSGGLIAALTGGLESRRSAIALATVNALSTLFFGLIEHGANAPR